MGRYRQMVSFRLAAGGIDYRFNPGRYFQQISGTRFTGHAADADRWNSAVYLRHRFDTYRCGANFKRCQPGSRPGIFVGGSGHEYGLSDGPGRHTRQACDSYLSIIYRGLQRPFRTARRSNLCALGYFSPSHGGSGIRGDTAVGTMGRRTPGNAFIDKTALQPHRIPHQIQQNSRSQRAAAGKISF